jgi:hypothetical protein
MRVFSYLLLVVVVELVFNVLVKFYREEEVFFQLKNLIFLENKLPIILGWDVK